GAHPQRAVDDRPLLARTVAIDLDPVAILVREVQRFADAVVRGALHHRARRDETTEGDRQIVARRNEGREVVEYGGAADTRPGFALRQDQQILSARSQPGRAIVAAMNLEP